MDAYRVWADIDLDALENNLEVVQQAAQPGVELILVVKADAYGHGAIAVAHHAARCGVAAFGVGTSAEALELRRAGICAPILVLGTVVDEEVAAILAHDIQVGVHSTSRCEQLAESARRSGTVARVHLNIDTGMGRLGVLPQKAPDLLLRIARSPYLELAGLMTHFSSVPQKAEETPGATQADHAQLDLFEEVLEFARTHDLLQGWVHAANSSALFRGSAPEYDAIRVGIAAYGILPGSGPHADRLRPVLSLRSQVVFLKDVPEGFTVGYDRTWVAPRASRIATLPVGYNDGVGWRVSNRGEVLVQGHRAPIVGRVSMDYTTVDVTDIAGVEVGHIATFIGRDGDEVIRAEDMARWGETIPYEVTCSVGKRVERVFRSAGATRLAQPRREWTSAARRPGVSTVRT